MTLAILVNNHGQFTSWLASSEEAAERQAPLMAENVLIGSDIYTLNCEESYGFTEDFES